MKKIIVMALAIAMFATPAFAGSLWGMIKNSDLPTLQSKAYQLEVKGVNVRVYVFKVPEMRSICTQVWGDNTVTMECKSYKELGLDSNGN